MGALFAGIGFLTKGGPVMIPLMFCSVLAVYLAVTLLIVVKSPLFTLDEHLANMHFRRHYPGLRPFIYYFVMLGQRGPATDQVSKQGHSRPVHEGHRREVKAQTARRAR